MEVSRVRGEHVGAGGEVGRGGGERWGGFGWCGGGSDGVAGSAEAGSERGVWCAAKGGKARAGLSLLRGGSNGSLAGDALHPPASLCKGGKVGAGLPLAWGEGSFSDGISRPGHRSS